VWGPDGGERTDSILHLIFVDHHSGIEPAHTVGDDVDARPFGKIPGDPDDLSPQVRGAAVKV